MTHRQPSSNEKVVIIGAGPAGLTTAYCLAKRGYACTILESEGYVGGLSRTLSLWGQNVDIGPHRFFSNNPRVNELWTELVREDYGVVRRLTRIYYRRRMLKYPLDLFNIMGNVGPLEALRCVGSYALALLKRGFRIPPNDFESWVVDRFGHRLYSLFFKSYSEKLWGISCQNLDSDFAKQRIKKFSLGEAIRGLMGASRTKHPTLVDQFAYPLDGSGIVYDRMAEFVATHGGEVRLNSPVVRINHDGRRVTSCVLKNGESLACDHLISTMPLTHLVSGLVPAPPPSIKEATQHLKFRSTILVYLNVEGDRHFADHWLYIHSPEVKVGRIANFKNWPSSASAPKGQSVLSLEYWCDRGDENWQRPDEWWAELAREELHTLGLTGSSSILDSSVLRVPYCYPIYSLGYREKLAPVIEYLRGFENLTAIGRYGSFKYNNQDHSLLMGILAAENIAEGRAHDLWEVNSDTNYLESGKALRAAGAEASV